MTRSTKRMKDINREAQQIFTRKYLEDGSKKLGDELNWLNYEIESLKRSNRITKIIR